MEEKCDKHVNQPETKRENRKKTYLRMPWRKRLRWRRKEGAITMMTMGTSYEMREQVMA
jgi:hypothetical protein